MSDTLRIQIVALTLGVVVVASLAGSIWKLVEDGAENEQLMLDHLAALADANAALDAEMLRASADLTRNYDQLAALEQRLVETLRIVGAHEALRRPVNFDYDRNRKGDADQDKGGVHAGLLAKLKALDNIKFKRAVVVNSSRYLPSALEDVPAADAAVVAAAAELKHASLQFALSGADEGHRLENQVKLIRKQFPQQRELLVAARHADNIRDATSSSQAYMREFFDTQLDEEIATLTRAYRSWREGEEQLSTWLKLALVFASTGLLFAIAWVLRAWSRTIEKLDRAQKSALRFAPARFLHELGKDFTDVVVGDAVKKEMTILFSDIRGFTTMSEQRTPEENFRFMNTYHDVMEVPIHEHAGFVNEYRGDGVVALFPDDADSALDAAIAMFKALPALPRIDDKPVRIGIGVNTGSVILGALGGKERMNPGVISDAVNVAARVEALTKRYGAPLIISEHTRARLRNRHQYTLRTVDRVQLVGMERPINLYEVVDADMTPAAALKREHLKRHEEAVERYFKGQFDEARALFERLFEVMPADDVIAMFLERCKVYIIDPPPKTWDGSTRLELK